jgi:hypothetical protein
MELTNWKTLQKKESWGAKNFGIEIRVAVDRDLNENDVKATYKIMDEIENAVLSESMRLDPEAQKERQEERTKLLECFGDRVIYVEEIPNGYGTSWYYSQSPWYRVTTSKGKVTLGWRKRVIEISWEPHNGFTADVYFPNEDVTKFGYTIHAWGYEKAKQYLATILS